MKIGTKSVLFGAHCFFLHPIFVAIAWTKLYGFPFDPRLWVAFFVHDLGYLGKPNVDEIGGETHAELGARIMHIFDGWDYKTLDCDWDWYKKHFMLMADYQKSTGWMVCDIIEFENSVNILLQKRKTYWYDFTLYHSHYYANKNNASPSGLYYADKLAFAVTPRWLYLLMVNISGEIHEYLRMEKNTRTEHLKPVERQKIWHNEFCMYITKWIEEHKKGNPDTWTNSNRDAITDSGITS